MKTRPHLFRAESLSTAGDKQNGTRTHSDPHPAVQTSHLHRLSVLSPAGYNERTPTLTFGNGKRQAI
jgi:hypothetical protein